MTVVVRPQKLSVGKEQTSNHLSGRVLSTSYLGGSVIYEIDIGGGTMVRCHTAINGKPAREGEVIDLGFERDGCVLLDANGRRIS